MAYYYNIRMSELQLIHEKSDLNAALKSFRLANKTIGFVPTMGALHRGHKALIDRAAKENDVVVISIFVNPTQFNNQEDLALYPRTLDADMELLNDVKNGFVYAPIVSDIYPENTDFVPMKLGDLDTVMEGEHRPGHFNGVVHVVHNLFEIVMPDKAYFGQKDFQQLAVIRALTKHYKFPIEIIGCETLRETSGLAMSSRNMRLSEQEKQDALIIWETLQFIKANTENFKPEELKQIAISNFKKSKLTLEYLEIVDQTSLQLANNWDHPTVCCIAAFCGKVRLIDNLLL